MDIESYKKLVLPKIKAGKITKIVRDIIKEVSTSKQDVYEGKKEEFMPLTEKIEKEIDEISKLREEIQGTPHFNQDELLAILNKQDEQSQGVINLNENFTDEDFKIFKKYNMIKPSILFEKGKEDINYYNKIRTEIGELNKDLGREKSKLSHGKKSK